MGNLWISRMVSAILQLSSRTRATVLIFHRVLPKVDPLSPSTPDSLRFEVLMRRLKQDFRVVSLSAVIDDPVSLPPRAVAITFDDGYADNATIAAPILHRLGLTATVFVASGFLDGGRMWNDTVIEAVRAWKGNLLDLADLELGVHPVESAAQRVAAITSLLGVVKYFEPQRRADVVRELASRLDGALPDDLMMTRAQVRGLAQIGMTVGAHTVSHPILARLPDSQAEREIRDSKRDLERIVSAPVDFFAYPNGIPAVDYTRFHVDAVRAAGYRGAVSTAVGAVTGGVDPYQIPRFTPWSRSPARFGLQLAGNFGRTRPLTV